MNNTKQIDEEKIRELSRNIQKDEEKRRLQEERQQETKRLNDETRRKQNEIQRLKEERREIEKTRLNLMKQQKRNNTNEQLTNNKKEQLSNTNKDISKIRKTAKMFGNKGDQDKKTRKLIPNLWARQKRKKMEDVYYFPEEHKLSGNQKSVIPGVNSPDIPIPIENTNKKEETKDEEETSNKMFEERNPILNRELPLSSKKTESIYPSSSKSSSKGSSDIASTGLSSDISSISDLGSSSDLENDDYKNLGFNETIKNKTSIKSSVPVSINICSNILSNGLKVNSKYYFPSEFPNITRDKSVSSKNIAKKGGKKNKYKTKKYRK